MVKEFRPVLLLAIVALIGGIAANKIAATQYFQLLFWFSAIIAACALLLPLYIRRRQVTDWILDRLEHVIAWGIKQL